MTIDLDLVQTLESLSAVALTPEERAAAQADLQAAVDRFDRLAAVDTQGVEPLVHVFPLANVTREDEVVESMDNELLTENAPWSKDGAFLVYRAVE